MALTSQILSTKHYFIKNKTLQRSSGTTPFTLGLASKCTMPEPHYLSSNCGCQTYMV